MNHRNTPKHPGAMTPAERTRQAVREIHTAIIAVTVTTAFITAFMVMLFN